MTNESLQRAIAAATAASDKKAADIVILNVAPIIGITDYFVICSGSSERQVGTIVEEIEERFRLQFGLKPYRREGQKDMRWVLIDYFEIVVHVLHTEEREFYELERLWKDAERVPFEDSLSAAEGGTST